MYNNAIVTERRLRRHNLAVLSGYGIHAFKVNDNLFDIQMSKEDSIEDYTRAYFTVTKKQLDIIRRNINGLHIGAKDDIVDCDGGFESSNLIKRNSGKVDQVSTRAHNGCQIRIMHGHNANVMKFSFRQDGSYGPQFVIMLTLDASNNYAKSFRMLLDKMLG